MKLTKYSTKFSKKQIILLSIPVFFANLATPLVGIVDTGLMGNLGQTKYLAATSIATSIMTMVIWSFAFLRMGTVGIVAQLFAKSDYREIIRTLIRNLRPGGRSAPIYYNATIFTYRKGATINGAEIL